MRDILVMQGRVKFDSKLDVRMKDLGLRKF